MIVNGASRCSASFWTQHLANDKKNDRAELKEIRGLAAENLKDGLLEMQEDASHTRCKNFMYQANFSPRTHEHLTEEQWQRAFEIFEKHRGIPEGQPRIVYEHEKEGRTHRHVVWSRIDLENNRAWSDAKDAEVCHAASREISEELGLERSVSPFDKDRKGPRPERAPKSYEMFRGLESGLDPRDIRKEVTAIFRESENSADFAAGLQHHGYVLAKGDRRDYCIIDQAGDEHSLARRLSGVKAPELREFMRGIDRDQLPSVSQAKETIRDLQQEQRLKDLATIEKEIAWEEALTKAAIDKEKVERRFVEPSEREMRTRKDLEKASPGQASTSGLPGAPIRREFFDAERSNTTPLSMPETLTGVSARIWTAYNTSKDPHQFQSALDKDNISLAVVTKDEANRSHRQAAPPKDVGTFTPRLREGEIVAVTAPGYVYRLNRHTTGRTLGGIERFLKPLDRARMSGIDGAKEFQRSRSDQKARAIQTSRELLATSKSAERAKAAKDLAGQTLRTNARNTDFKPLPIAAATAGLKLAEGVLGIGGKLADGLASLFAAEQTPAQRHEGHAMRLERDEKAEEKADLLKYTAARTAEIQHEEARNRDDQEREW